MIWFTLFTIIIWSIVCIALVIQGSKIIRSNYSKRSIKISNGLGLGILIFAAIAIPFSEFLGYHDAYSLFPFGICFGLLIGIYLDKRDGKSFNKN